MEWWVNEGGVVGGRGWSSGWKRVVVVGGRGWSSGWKRVEWWVEKGGGGGGRESGGGGGWWWWRKVVVALGKNMVNDGKRSGEGWVVGG